MLDIKIEDYKSSKYNYIGEFHEGLACVKNRNDKYGYINKIGKEVIPCQFLRARSFQEGLAAIKTTRGCGYIDKSGKMVIEDNFYKASDFREGLAVASKDGKSFGYINRNGQFEIEPNFEMATNFSDDYGIVKKQDKYHYIDKRGHLSRGYRYCTTFEDGLSIAIMETSYLVINSCQEIIASVSTETFSNVSQPSEKMILVQNRDGSYGYYDENLQIKIPVLYSSAHSFRDGMAIVSTNDTIGFINHEGIMVAFVRNKQYQSIQDFKEGLACVQNRNGKYGYIDKAGKRVIPCQFINAHSFSEGLAGVIEEGKKFSYINKKGIKKIVIPEVYFSKIIVNGYVAYYVEAETKEELRAKKIEYLETFKQQHQQEVDRDIKKAKQYVLEQI